MSMERALFKLVTGVTLPVDSNLGAGTTPDPWRVYYLRAPDGAGAKPFVVLQRVDSETWRDINGPSGIAQAVMQLDTYASTFYKAKDMALTIQKALDGFRGTVNVGSGPSAVAVKIGGISFQNDIDIIDETESPLLFRVSASYRITYHY